MKRTQLLMLQLARQELWKLATSSELNSFVTSYFQNEENVLKTTTGQAFDNNSSWRIINTIHSEINKFNNKIKGEIDKIDAVIADLDEELEKE